MARDGDGEAIRREAAQRYAEWVSGQMQQRGWNAATLSRRSGLKKQTVGQILKGESAQPTAWQIASLARTFNVAPNEIFEASGLWESSGETVLPSDLLRLYRSLGFPGRRALLGAGRVIQEFQAEYQALQRGEEDMGDIAAFSEPDLAQSMYEDAQTGEENQDPEGDA